MIDFNIPNLIIEEDAKIVLNQYYNTNNIDQCVLDLYFRAIFLGIVKKGSSIINKAKSLNNNYSIDCSIDEALQNIRICWKENNNNFTITSIESYKK